MYAILEIFKLYYENEIFSAVADDIYRIFIGRPAQKANFDLQFMVRLNTELAKINLAILLRHFLLSTKIDERLEKFSRLRSIFSELKVPAKDVEVEQDIES